MATKEHLMEAARSLRFSSQRARTVRRLSEAIELESLLAEREARYEALTGEKLILGPMSPREMQALRDAAPPSLV
jgi:hypothetical protein